MFKTMQADVNHVKVFPFVRIWLDDFEQGIFLFYSKIVMVKSLEMDILKWWKKYSNEVPSGLCVQPSFAAAAQHAFLLI